MFCDILNIIIPKVWDLLLTLGNYNASRMTPRALTSITRRTPWPAQRSCGQAHSLAQSPSLRPALISRYYWDRGVPAEIAPRHWETRHPATPFVSPLDSLLPRPPRSISNSAILSFNKAIPT